MVSLKVTSSTWVKHLAVASLVRPGYTIHTHDVRVRGSMWQPRWKAAARPSADSMPKVSDRIQFFRAASDMPFPLDTCQASMSGDVMATVDKICASGADIVKWRSSRMSLSQEAAAALRPLSQSLERKQAPHVAAAARRSHPALMCCLIEAMKWPDTHIL